MLMLNNLLLISYFFIADLVAASSVQDNLYQLTQDDRFKILAFHNQIRKNYGLNENDLVWSDTLEKSAGEWACQCRFEHSVSSEFGENIALYGVTPGYKKPFPWATWVQQMDEWKSEESSWDCPSNQCSEGCGYLRQIIWRPTTEVGCAMARCDSGTCMEDYDTQYFVCHYSPAGNYPGVHPLDTYSNTYSDCPVLPTTSLNLPYSDNSRWFKLNKNSRRETPIAHLIAARQDNLYSLTRDDRDKILTLHNRIRQNYLLSDLVWSDTLEKSAAEWACQCRFEHSASDCGENLALYGVTPGDMTPFPWASWVQQLDHWKSEESSWDCRSNLCSDGDFCEHLTQIIWNTTTEVGCSLARCDSGSCIDDYDTQFFVCHYSPAGNYPGEHPLNPYSDSYTYCPDLPKASLQQLKDYSTGNNNCWFKLNNAGDVKQNVHYFGAK